MRGPAVLDARSFFLSIVALLHTPDSTLFLSLSLSLSPDRYPPPLGTVRVCVCVRVLVGLEREENFGSPVTCSN